MPLSLGILVALCIRMLLWQAGTLLGYVPLMDVSIAAVFCIGLGIGGLVSGHVMRNRTQSPAIVWPAALFAIAAVLYASFAPPYVVEAARQALGNILALRRGQSLQALLVAPAVAALLSGVPALLLGLAWPWAFNRLEAERGLAAQALGALAATAFLTLAPGLGVAWWPEAVLSAVALAMLLAARPADAAADASASLVSKRHTALAFLVLLLAAASMAVWVGLNLRVVRMSIHEGPALAIAAMSLLTAVVAGAIAGARVSERSRIRGAGIALLVAGIGAVVVTQLMRSLPGVMQAVSPWPPAAILTQYLLLSALLMVPAGGMSMGGASLIGSISRNLKFSLASSSTLAASIFAIVFALVLQATGSLLVAYVSIADGLLLGGAVAALGGLLALILHARQSRSGIASVVVAAIVGLGVFAAARELNRPWQMKDWVPQASEDSRLTLYDETLDGSLAVTQAPDQTITVYVDGRRVLSSDSSEAAAYNALGTFPLLLTPSVLRAAIDGAGSGEVIEAARVPAVFVFEPRPSILAAAAAGFRETSGEAFSRSGVRILRQDLIGRLRTSNDRYNVIMLSGDSTEASAPSRESLSLCLEHLEESGTVAMLVRASQHSVQSFRSLAATFLETFEHVVVLEAEANAYLFLGSRQPLRMNVWSYLQRLKGADFQQALAAFNPMKNPESIPSTFICEGAALRPLLTEEPLQRMDLLRTRKTLTPEPDNTEQILALLLSAQTDPFKAFLDTTNLPDKQEPLLREAIGRRIQARRVRLDFQRAVQRGRLADAMQFGQAMLRLSGADPRARDLFRTELIELAERRRSLGDAQGADSLERSLKLLAPPPATQPAPDSLAKPVALDSFLQAGREALKSRNYEEAEKQFRAAYNVRPDNEEARYELARLVLATNRWAEALELLEPLRKRKLKPEIRVTIASALAEGGRANESLAELKQALQEGFSDRRLLETTPFLANVRSTQEFQDLLKTMKGD